jgi:hypothetical protein
MNRQSGRFDFPGLSHKQKVNVSIQPNHDSPQERHHHAQSACIG